MAIKVNGEWCYLSEFSNYEEIEEVGGIEEADDYPEGLSIEKYFDELQEWEEASSYERKIMEAYFEATGIFDLGTAMDAYRGKYSDNAEFAQEICEELESGALNVLPDYLRKCIDWDKVWDEKLSDSYFVENGLYFSED